MIIAWQHEQPTQQIQTNHWTKRGSHAQWDIRHGPGQLHHGGSVLVQKPRHLQCFLILPSDDIFQRVCSAYARRILSVCSAYAQRTLSVLVCFLSSACLLFAFCFVAFCCSFCFVVCLFLLLAVCCVLFWTCCFLVFALKLYSCFLLACCLQLK